MSPKIVRLSRFSQRTAAIASLLFAGCTEHDPEQDYQRGLALAEAGDHAAAVEIWTPLADAGKLEAQLALAAAYVRGRGTGQDYPRALELYRAAEAQGSNRALYALGLMHLHGDGVPLSAEQAVTYFRQAAQADHGKSQLRLAQAYQEGLGVPKSLADAYEWSTRAWLLGEPQAETLRSEVRNQALELSADEAADAVAFAALLRREHELEAAQRLLEPFAHGGHADAQAELGYLYWLQVAQLEDPQTSPLLAQVEHWSRLAAQQGSAIAMNNLGMLFKDGLGVKQDVHIARSWFERATELEEPRALVNLAYLYENGLGVAKDSLRAQKLTRQAAELGSPQGQYYVGRRYQLGDGVPQDPAQARQWYERAAMQGYADAQTALGGLYYLGQGVERDLVRAFQWMGVGAANADGVANSGGGARAVSSRELYQSLILELDDQTIERGSLQLRKTLPLIVAAEIGDPHAMVDMGYLAAAEGKMQKARRLFSSSAEAGFSEGMEALAGWHLLQRDRKAALKWYTLAAVRNGQSEDTLDSIAQLLPTLTKAEVEEAQESVRAWQQQRAHQTNKEG